jgi:hypothetical protein
MLNQYDTTTRVVSLENLKAMCSHVSGHGHRFSVTKVSRSRVHVEYSNPDEYGRDHPETAVYPCYPNPALGNGDNPYVVFDCMRVLNDNKDGEGWQDFEELRECPTLYRNVVRATDYSQGGRGEITPHEQWRTHLQIRKDGDEKGAYCLSACGCVICDVVTCSCKDCGAVWSDTNPVSFCDSANGYLCNRCNDARETGARECDQCYRECGPEQKARDCPCGLFVCDVCANEAPHLAHRLEAEAKTLQG